MNEPVAVPTEYVYLITPFVGVSSLSGLVIAVTPAVDTVARLPVAVIESTSLARLPCESLNVTDKVAISPGL